MPAWRIIPPPGTIQAEPPPYKAPRGRNYKRQSDKIIAANFAAIMTTLAEKAAAGSLPHIKFLFEIGGVKEEIKRQARNKAEPSLAELLFAEVHAQRGRLLLTPGEPPDRAYDAPYDPRCDANFDAPYHDDDSITETGITDNSAKEA